ncbi:hypothetical protein RF11_07646 [Thelohanellus kitauei]|uniref:Uncharacterized protein n=1 Tax=Thelohanellus kitauei TaxID=669202 RepID=A0A0C2MSZ4_THEKT|nr:hypothetical protein RF11_07646 [Thelohanellus kitauei]
MDLRFTTMNAFKIDLQLVTRRRSLQQVTYSPDKAQKRALAGISNKFISIPLIKNINNIISKFILLCLSHVLYSRKGIYPFIKLEYLYGDLSKILSFISNENHRHYVSIEMNLFRFLFEERIHLQIR